MATTVWLGLGKDCRYGKKCVVRGTKLKLLVKDLKRSWIWLINKSKSLQLCCSSGAKMRTGKKAEKQDK